MGKCWRRDVRVVRNCWGRCEEMWRCKKVCEHPILFYTSPTLFHSSPHPNALPYTSTLTPYALPHLSHTSPPPNTFPHFFHIPPYLTQLPKLPKISQFSHHPYSLKFSTLPRFFPILPHTYFIIYPISKFLTFLIYCLISLAIKCTRRIKNFENQNKQ